LTIDQKFVGVVSTEMFFKKVSEISNFKFQNQKKIELQLKIKKNIFKKRVKFSNCASILRYKNIFYF
jgi:hypothetical protein